MSTIEDIVLRVQNGETDLMPELWENVHAFIAWRARRLLSAIENRRGVEVDDLVNSGYFALLDAIRTYRRDESGFLSWLSIHLRNSFSATTGFRTQAQKNDTLRFSVSLSLPLDDESGDTLGDILADPGVDGQFEAVEQKIYIEQLRSALLDVVDKLPPQQADTIRHRYFEGQTYAEIGKGLEVSTSRAQQLEDEALRKLRSPEAIKRLESFVDSRTPYFLPVGPPEFQRNHTSSVETIVFLRERLRNYGEKHIMEGNKWT